MAVQQTPMPRLTVGYTQIRRIEQVLGYATVAAVALIMILPLYWMLATALKGGGVAATFRELLLRVLPGLEAEHGLSDRHGLAPQALLDSLGLTA